MPHKTKEGKRKKLAKSFRPSLFTTMESIITDNNQTSFDAFLQENEGKSVNAKFLLANWKEFKPLFTQSLPLLKEIITREISRPEHTFAFYNGSSNAIKFFRMVMSIIYKEEGLGAEIESIKPNLILGRLKAQSFSPQRFFEKTIDQKKFLYPFNNSYNLKERPVFDHEKKITKNLLAASILLHDGNIGESGWLLFQENFSISINSDELTFLRVIFGEFFIKKGWDTFPIDKLVELYAKYKNILQAQLLQIFISETAFNDLGYYCYAGGVPVVKDSASFLHDLLEEFKNQDSTQWKKVVTENLTKAFKENKLYHLADRPYPPCDLVYDDGAEVDWLGFLQARFITTNPDFYTSSEITINEYYQSDEAYYRAKELKGELKSLINLFFEENQKSAQKIR
ncbi:hypothetical protein ACQUW5_00590 [Legionella sp. CNM-1927-20]|uniref:hypothetical protein n=1 Tax=Legionella sp. CNM-1927-20 TaxID=3422221 RepID=UPI00403A8156